VSTAAQTLHLDWQALPVPKSLLGESPFWHPDEAALYWCDIPGKTIHRWHPGRAEHQHWLFDSEPGSMAPRLQGGLLVAFRDGLFHVDLASGQVGAQANAQRQLLCPPPYDPSAERFNDGKADPQGRFWVGTIYEPRQPALAALYCWRSDTHSLTRVLDGITVSNGLAFSPDGQRLLWSDTQSHRIFALHFDGSSGQVSGQRTWASFPVKTAATDLDRYGGRPDGAAVDAEGATWVAMFEGQRLLRMSAQGTVLQEVPLPVRCATMPCLGGPDLRTLFVTTAHHGRPAAELAQQPLAGCVLQARVDVPGLPVHFAA
jgi:sugar lactone lactonase YvrE